jgi:hypothetical protein
MLTLLNTILPDFWAWSALVALAVSLLVGLRLVQQATYKRAVVLLSLITGVSLSGCEKERLIQPANQSTASDSALAIQAEARARNPEDHGKALKFATPAEAEAFAAEYLRALRGEGFTDKRIVLSEVQNAKRLIQAFTHGEALTYKTTKYPATRRRLPTTPDDPPVAEGEATCVVQSCTDWYSGSSGEFIATTCTYELEPCDGGSGGGGNGGSGNGNNGGGSGGGGGGGNGGGVTEEPPIDFETTPTTATVEPDLPSDCRSWQFRAVGPSGYLACGVTGVEIDLLSQYRLADGTEGIGLNVYYANLYFEMPPRYSPGEAATLCAQIKDEVEEILEERYRNQYPPDIAQTINSTFIREMTTRVARLGGRVTQTPRYRNTPVNQYSHTFLPNNGGCM